jgi:hypothetical protein
MRALAIAERQRAGAFWRPASVALAIAATAVFFWYARSGVSHGGSPAGLVFGIAAFLLIIFLSLFGVRKRAYRSRLGTVEGWVQAHIYLGLLVPVLLLLHAGGRFHDRLAVASFILAMVVAASGVAGAILYATMPRNLTDAESNVPPSKLSEQINDLGRSMASAASNRSAVFQRVFESFMKESAPPPLAGWRLLLSRADLQRQLAGHDWASLLALVPAEEQEALRDMLVVARQRRELLLRLIVQQRYRAILEGWLWIHIPFTVALLIAATAHVIAALYYGAVRW